VLSVGKKKGCIFLLNKSGGVVAPGGAPPPPPRIKLYRVALPGFRQWREIYDQSQTVVKQGQWKRKLLSTLN